MKLVNAQRESRRIDIHWVRVKCVTCMLMVQPDESHDEFVKVTTQQRSLPVGVWFCHMIRHVVENKRSRDQEKLFVSVWMLDAVWCVCTWKDMRVRSVKGEVDWKTQGVLGNGIASSQRVCACASTSAFIPKNKMIPLPSRPYGTDNELVLHHSSVLFPRRGWKNGSHWGVTFFF